MQLNVAFNAEINAVTTEKKVSDNIHEVKESLGGVLINLAMGSAVLSAIRENDYTRYADGFVMPVLEALGSGKTIKRWLTIKEDGEETHIAVGYGGLVVAGPKHLLNADIHHLPPHDGREVIKHPKGKKPDTAEHHPSYEHAEAHRGVPYARLHGAKQPHPKEHALSEEETHNGLKKSIKELKSHRAAAEKEAAKQATPKKVEADKADMRKKPAENEDKQNWDRPIPVKEETKSFDHNGGKLTVTTVTVGFEGGKHYVVTGSNLSKEGKEDALSPATRKWNILNSSGSHIHGDLGKTQAIKKAKDMVRGKKAA